MPPPVPVSAARKDRPTWLLVVFIGIPLVAFVIFATARVVVYSRLNTQMKPLRAAKMPTSGAELNDWLPTVPTNENGALILTQAFATLKPFPTRKDGVTPTQLLRSNKWSDEFRAEAQIYIDSNADALKLVGAALEKERFQFPVDYSLGPSTLLPHLAKIKEIEELLALKTRVQFGNDNTNLPALLLQQIKLGRTLDGEPTIIGLLVRASCLRIAATSAKTALNGGAPPTEIAERLQKEFLSAANTNVLPRALIGERALAIQVFKMDPKTMELAMKADDSVSEVERQQQFNLGRKLIGASGFFDRDLRFYLSAISKGIEAAKRPEPQNLECDRILSAEAVAAKRNLCFLSGLLLPSSRAQSKLALAQADLRMAGTAFAIERYRHARRALPATLTDLTPEFLTAVPLDPVTGATLGYERITNGFQLRCARPPELNSKEMRETSELTFTVHR